MDTTLRRKNEEKNRQPVGYFNDAIATILEGEDFELLAPGVTQVTLPDENVTTTLLHISIFHQLGGSTVSGLEIILGLIMAAYHFNNRIDTIVPRLSELESCDIKLSMELFDEGATATRNAEQLLKEILPRKSSTSKREQARYPTGIIGGTSSTASELLAIMGGIQNMTQMSFTSAANTLENKDQYPYFNRVISPASGISRVAVDFFLQRFDSSHVFVIFFRGSLGSDLYNFFNERATQLGITTNSASISIDSSCADCQEKDIEAALNLLEQSGFKHIYAIVLSAQYEEMLPKALDRGLAGPGNFWLFVETFAFPPQESGAPLLAASHGSAVLGFPQGPLYDAYDKFTEEWVTYIATNATKEALGKLLPDSVAESETFQNYVIPPFSDRTFGCYDAFMSLALTACDASAMEGPTFREQVYLNTLRNIQFQGATGEVRFNNITGSRDQRTFTMKIANKLADGPLNADGQVTFRTIDSYLYEINEDGSGASWNPREGTTFIYSDNTTTAPPDIPLLVQSNDEIHLWSIICGYLACATLVILAAAFLVWMQINIKTDPVRSAQPFFVRIVVLGVVMMGLSLIPQAALASSPIPDICCMMSPWLLAIGFCFTFAALFSRLIRINKIDDSSRRMKRVKIEPMQVVVPFMILLALNVGILTTWSIVDPLTYSATFDGNLDTFGRSLSFTSTCQSETSAYFRIAIGILDMTALALTGYHSYKARNTKVAYNENIYILYGLIGSSQSFFIGVPLVVAVGNPSVAFFCRTLAILVGCLGISLPLFLPKFSQVRKWKAKKVEKEAKKQERIQRANAYFANVSTQASATTGAGRTKQSVPTSYAQSSIFVDDSSAVNFA